MDEKIALKNILKLGIVLMAIGFIVSFCGLFSSIEEFGILNFSLMLTGVIVTSFGYALSSLYFYRGSSAKDSKKHQFCVGC
ncbi:MAG: hypothetical protein QG567_1531 [Campylobacterota bacterium]|nr:hypothetical protein [Campylobacterota bacterium]